VLHVRIDVPPEVGALAAVAEGLTLLNVELMRIAEEKGMPDFPELYKSGVVYRREPPGREWWESASDLLGIAKDRSGDCEDLSAYRAAELRYYDDENASVLITQNPSGNFHCRVLREDGTVEDPSLILLRQESRATGVPIEDLQNKVTTDTRYAP
jgi:hypothetical protein